MIERWGGFSVWWRRMNDRESNGSTSSEPAGSHPEIASEDQWWHRVDVSTSSSLKQIVKRRTYWHERDDMREEPEISESEIEDEDEQQKERSESRSILVGTDGSMDPYCGKGSFELIIVNRDLVNVSSEKTISTGELHRGAGIVYGYRMDSYRAEVAGLVRSLEVLKNKLEKTEFGGKIELFCDNNGAVLALRRWTYLEVEPPWFAKESATLRHRTALLVKSAEDK